uniref:rho GTPase-activating protein 21 n=1 Tax=Myxine glutinosa TaxID=7769 RepID=UPI0035901476
MATGPPGPGRSPPAACEMRSGVQSLAWPGPRTVSLIKGPQGFGFTLRHFIVYPPESLHSLQKDEDGKDEMARRFREGERVKVDPMDTIFVKQVKEGSPAHEAGLQTGDRVVKINGDSIIGKSYLQVISSIQNCDSVLQLSVMPKDEDILQLAYSQDAYMKGSEPYTGRAQDIPEPPPLVFSSSSLPPAVHSPTAGWPSHYASVPAVPTCYGMPISSHSETFSKFENKVYSREKPPMQSGNELELTKRNQGFRNIPAGHKAIGTGDVIQHRPYGSDDMRIRMTDGLKSRHWTSEQGQTPSAYGYPTARFQHSEHMQDYLAVKAFMDGSHEPFQTYKDYRRAYGARTLHERLDSLRSASQNRGAPPNYYHGGAGASGSGHTRTRSVSHDRGPAAMPRRYRSVSQDRLANNVNFSEWSRSISQDAIAQHGCRLAPAGCAVGSTRQGRKEDLQLRGLASEGYMSTSKNQAHNCVEHPTWTRGLWNRPSPDGQHSWCQGEEIMKTQNSMVPQPKVMSEEKAFPKGPVESKKAERTRLPAASSCSVKPPKLTELRKMENQHQRSKSLESHSLLQASGHKVPSLSSKRCGNVKDSNSSSVTSLPGVMPITVAPRKNAKGLERRRAVFCEATGIKDVVLREKPPSGRLAPPLRHPSYIMAVNSVDNVSASPEIQSSRQKGNLSVRTTQEVLKEDVMEDSSLATIPFIDEPGSPTTDDSEPISASSVVSASSRPTPSLSLPPTSPATMSRQLSHDTDEVLRGSRRSSYLMATGGERSKSYDEGLDEICEDGKTSLKPPKRVPSIKKLKSFFSEGIVESPEPQEEPLVTRRKSTSDIVNLSRAADVTKEGWLHFRCHGDKAISLSGCMRPWKQVFAVLQGPSLYLCKDQREASVQGFPEDEQPIDIRNCLIDISYSDTKRKNAFRLTTSDCFEFLFQADSRDDMLDWIGVIQKNSNPDGLDSGESSRDLISRKIKEYTVMNTATGKVELSPKAPRQMLGRQPFLVPKADHKMPPRSPKQESDKVSGKEEPSPPKDKTTWRKGIQSIMKRPFVPKPTSETAITFGVRLEDCPQAYHNKYLPLIVEICCHLVEEKGLDSTGIYRVPGNNAAVSSLQDDLNRGSMEIDTSDEKWRDLNVISSLLKLFFRKLPDPLFTDDKYRDFIEANRKTNATDRLKALRRMLHELPPHHYQTLKFLSKHLHTVAAHSAKNKMEPRNLAIVFGPTLVRTSADNMTDMVTHMPDQYKIVETLIEQQDWFFKDEVGEEAMTPLEDKAPVESQPVPNIDHLLINIGRTVPASEDLSDASATSDSVKSKKSWGSNKDLYSRELINSIIAAAHRKRKKVKEPKQSVNSSDEDTEFGFVKGNADQLCMRVFQEGNRNGSATSIQEAGADGENNNLFGSSRGRALQQARYGRMEASHASSTPCMCSGNGSVKLSSERRGAEVKESEILKQKKCASQDVLTQNTRRRDANSREVLADVVSVTSDYSTTSSSNLHGWDVALVMGANTGGDAQSLAESRGDEADDERSELISEGAQNESQEDLVGTGDIIGDVDTRSVGSSIEGPQAEGESGGNGWASSPAARRAFNSYRLIECDTLARKHSGRKRSAQVKGQEDGKALAATSTKLEMDEEPLEPVRPEPELPTNMSHSQAVSKTDPMEAWRPQITDRLRSRLRISADDMFGIGRKPAVARRNRVRRRHTLGGRRDCEELQLQEACRYTAEATHQRSGLSAVDRLKPKCLSQDFSIAGWIERERLRTSMPELLASPEACREARTEENHDQCRPQMQDIAVSRRSQQTLRDWPVPLGEDGIYRAHLVDPETQRVVQAQLLSSQFHQYL